MSSSIPAASKQSWQLDGEGEIDVFSDVARSHIRRRVERVRRRVARVSAACGRPGCSDGVCVGLVTSVRPRYALICFAM